jgi:hypothetical protein
LDQQLKGEIVRQKLDPDNLNKLTKADRDWIKMLPNPTFFAWSGMKHAVMDRLAIPRQLFVNWTMPEEWRDAMIKEARLRG